MNFEGALLTLPAGSRTETRQHIFLLQMFLVMTEIDYCWSLIHSCFTASRQIFA